ncbi:MAG: hypothetical protein IJO01_07685 [Oscillospiraceae bacterium]|nr:hypothetical protein [Oscillospiraceae bacterium]
MKKIISIILIFTIFFLFSACGDADIAAGESEPEVVSDSEEFSRTENVPQQWRNGFSEEDAKNLVQWTLDAAIKGVVSEENAEAVGMTVEEAEEEYIRTVIYEAEFLYTLIGEDKYIEDAIEKCCRIMDDIHSQIDYTVKDAVKTGDTRFEVTVDVRPINLTEYLTTELEKEVKKFGEVNETGLSEEEAEEQLAKIVFDIYEKFSKNVKYEETETITVIVEQTFDGSWIIDEESSNILVTALIPA